MRQLLRREDGSALVAAIVLLGAMIGLGLAVHAAAETQNRQSGQERVRESAFGVTEAAVNAQVFQLSKVFPTQAANAYPASCTPASGTAGGCPDGGDFQGYNGGDYSTTCNGSAVTRWTTTVRDNSNGAEQYYNAAVVNGNPRWDSNFDGALWVRADGKAGCRTRSIVTLVRAGDQQVAYPRNVVTANAFSTTNRGKKVIINTKGDAATPADVSLRCSGFASATTCATYERGKDQLSPDTLQAPAPSPSPLITGDALESIKAKARSLGTYYAAGVCPPTLTGEVVYVETLSGTCGVSRAANSYANPGFLVIGNGVFNIGGNSVFYGTLYMRNEQGSAGVVVSIQGTASIVGSVAVDGAGIVSAGSSKANVVYDSRSQTLVKGLGSATAVPNTWRELPTTP